MSSCEDGCKKGTVLDLLLNTCPHRPRWEIRPSTLLVSFLQISGNLFRLHLDQAKLFEGCCDGSLSGGLCRPSDLLALSGALEESLWNFLFEKNAFFSFTKLETKDASNIKFLYNSSVAFF